MTGKLARIIIGSCMTAALAVSGFAGSMPAAHAGEKCVIAVSGVAIQCVDVNALNHVVTIDVGNVTVSLVTVKDVLNNNWVNIPIASGNSVEIETAVKNVLNHANILSCLINVTIVSGGTSTGNCS